MAYKYIDKNNAVMGGTPTIKGTRVPITTIINLYEKGLTTKDIMKKWSFLTREQIEGAFKEAYEKITGLKCK
jgi:uncharacterized protein (DUF433 family)